MNTRTTAAAVATTVVAAIAVVAPNTAPASARTENDAARQVRLATIDERHVEAAEEDGYGQFLTCVQELGAGAMGTHWVNGELVSDATIDPQRPEALMYETRRNGRLALVGVEYIVFAHLWDESNDRAPQLFGNDFHLVGEPNRYGIPAFYALHVWAWKHNPSGTFADWNPRVSCRHAEGDPI